MNTLNFKELEIYTDISKTKKVKGDARESFANIIYTQANGIKMHALAMKIYNSEGEISFSDEDMQIIMDIANRYCTPSFIDGLNQQIKNTQS